MSVLTLYRLNSVAAQPSVAETLSPPQACGTRANRTTSTNTLVNRLELDICFASSSQ